MPDAVLWVPLPAPVLTTRRLELRPVDAAYVADVTAGRRRSSWAEDFPTEGDVGIARLLAEHGSPVASAAPLGNRLVVERSTGLVVGGIGLRQPSGDVEGGRVELGYGVVPSRQGRGYATEAARELVAFALRQPGVREVVAHAQETNPASVRVLEKAGLVHRSREGSLLEYARTAPL